MVLVLMEKDNKQVVVMVIAKATTLPTAIVELVLAEETEMAMAMETDAEMETDVEMAKALVANY